MILTFVDNEPLGTLCAVLNCNVAILFQLEKIHSCRTIVTLPVVVGNLHVGVGRRVSVKSMEPHEEAHSSATCFSVYHKASILVYIEE